MLTMIRVAFHIHRAPLFSGEPRALLTAANKYIFIWFFFFSSLNNLYELYVITQLLSANPAL